MPPGIKTARVAGKSRRAARNAVDSFMKHLAAVHGGTPPKKSSVDTAMVLTYFPDLAEKCDREGVDALPLGEIARAFGVTYAEMACGISRGGERQLKGVYTEPLSYVGMGKIELGVVRLVRKELRRSMECAICFSPLAPYKEGGGSKFACHGRELCDRCIDRWTKTNGDTCPMCRAEPVGLVVLG